MSETLPRAAETGLTLEKGEKALAEIRTDRGRYWRDHAVLALLGMVGAGAVLWFLGSDHVAIGSLGAVLALAVRGLYLASEQFRAVWVLTDRRIVLPGGRAVMLLEIDTIRKLMGDIQIITRAGDKHLIKHVANPEATIALVDQARARRARRAQG